MKSSRFLVAGVLVLAACNVQRGQTARGPEQPATEQGHAGLPPSDSTAAARLRSSPRHGEWVKIAAEEGSRDSLMAWVVYPASRTRAAVVVVVHEIYGLTTWVRGVADQVAAEGFIAVAPDFNSRVRGGPSTVELTRDSASRIIRGVDAAERNRIIVAAANYGMTQPSAEQRYAVIGYCWGGGTVFNHAVHGGVRGYSGGVAYYGISYLTAGQRATATSSAVPASFMVDSLARIEQPLMLLNGSLDMRIAAAMPSLDTVMKRLKKDYTGINYDGAIHGFLRAQDDPRPVRGEARNQQGQVTRPAESEEAVNAERAANLAAARDAWPKTVAFLKRTLSTR